MQIDIFNTTNKYKIIYCDPAWSFKTYSDAGKDRSPDNHYKVMNLQDIKNLPVKQLADKDCVLFMWTIDTHVPQALEVMKSWGFTYKTVGFTWTKINKSAKLNSIDASKDVFTGMGYWTRSNPEMCLLGESPEFDVDRCFMGTIGKPKRESMSVRRAVLDYRREHSRKPDQIYDRIEQLLGDIPRIELFARTERPGWDVWGDQVDKFKQE